MNMDGRHKTALITHFLNIFNKDRISISLIFNACFGINEMQLHERKANKCFLKLHSVHRLWYRKINTYLRTFSSIGKLSKYIGLEMVWLIAIHYVCKACFSSCRVKSLKFSRGNPSSPGSPNVVYFCDWKERNSSVNMTISYKLILRRAIQG